MEEGRTSLAKIDQQPEQVQLKGIDSIGSRDQLNCIELSKINQQLRRRRAAELHQAIRVSA
jgi:hypothetical protein